jgi:1,4-alpha-glucan branching enzyme
MSKTKIKRRRVIFSIEEAKAKEVYLMGNFNNWNSKKHPMQRNKDGVWSKAVMLSSGKYEYKFLIDGEWREDPRNKQTCPNCFGTQNSVFNLTVS